jgi:hypothetical protein
MPILVDEARATFRLAGPDFEPYRDEDWKRASEADRKAYWNEVGRLAYAAKQRELAQGIGVDGKPLFPVKHPRPDGAKGPPLSPHRIQSRFRRYLDWREGRDGVTLFWGHSWRAIVGYHMLGKGHLPVRNVVGLTLPSQNGIRERARRWWRARNPLNAVRRLFRTPPRQPTTPTVPAVAASLGLAFARPRPGWTRVVVDVARVDAVLRHRPAEYVGRGAEKKGGARANAERFIARARRDGTPFEPPRLGLDVGGGVSIEDGRHRWAVLRDEGHPYLVVEVPATEAARIKARFGGGNFRTPSPCPPACRDRDGRGRNQPIRHTPLHPKGMSPPMRRSLPKSITAALTTLVLVLAPVSPAFAADVTTARVLPLVQLQRNNSLANGVSAGNINLLLPYGQTAINFANGTAAGQVNKGWVVNSTAAISTADNYDLSSLPAAAAGTAVTAKVKVFAIFNHETVAGHDITFAGGAATPWVGPLGGTTPTYVIGPGESMTFYALSTAGFTVDGTHKLWKVTPGAYTANYSVVVAGN